MTNVYRLNLITEKKDGIIYKNIEISCNDKILFEIPLSLVETPQSIMVHFYDDNDRKHYMLHDSLLSIYTLGKHFTSNLFIIINFTVFHKFKDKGYGNIPQELLNKWEELVNILSVSEIFEADENSLEKNLYNWVFEKEYQADGLIEISLVNSPKKIYLKYVKEGENVSDLHVVNRIVSETLKFGDEKVLIKDFENELKHIEDDVYFYNYLLSEIADSDSNEKTFQYLLENI